MSDRQPHAPAAGEPKAAFSTEEFNMVGDLVRELRDQVKGRKLGRFVRTAVARRRDLRMGYGIVKHLPVLEVRLPADPRSDTIRMRLGGKLPGKHVRVARAALQLPADRATYLRGRPKQALRTNLRHAEANGITCHTLRAIEEQDAALKAFFGSGRFTDADRLYLSEKLDVNPGQQEFFETKDADGNTIAIAAVIVSGRTSLLLFHHSNDSEHTAVARYALTMHILTTLIEREVEVMLVGSALTLEPGLRYFQRRLGFVPVNVRVTGTDTPAAQRSVASVVA